MDLGGREKYGIGWQKERRRKVWGREGREVKKTVYCSSPKTNQNYIHKARILV